MGKSQPPLTLSQAKQQACIANGVAGKIERSPDIWAVRSNAGNWQSGGLNGLAGLCWTGWALLD